MCGIAGFFGGDANWHNGQAKHILDAMTEAIQYRGPDSHGCWIDYDERIALGHLRLAIVDLSTAGEQPMHSYNSRYVISFNGEIYNFENLRAEINAHTPTKWQGYSDTQVLLEYITIFGLEKCLTSIDGMFALALFDKHKHSLTLARDPFGEKPLYYGMCNNSLVFGSELKAITATLGFNAKLDLSSAADFFKYSYVPAPRTIYEGIYKLPPAHFLTITRPEIEKGLLPDPQPYWCPVETALSAKSEPFSGSFADARCELDRLLLGATKRRMMSDVPLGALLSGGIDSSLVTALMQANSNRPVRTFSIGMDIDGFNEADHARAVSKRLGTDHTELILTPKEIQSVLPDIAGRYDEPFADSSQIPTFMVSKMARERVTVALTGDGADEIFGGYNRYFHGANILKKLQKIPAPFRKTMGAMIGALPMRQVNSLTKMMGGMAPRDLASGRAAEKLQKLARILAQKNEVGFHDRLLATADNTANILHPDVKPSVLVEGLDPRVQNLPFAERAMLMDVGNYMVDDVLVKVDRATMAVALETRTPYLNRDIYDFAWSLPMSMKVGTKQGKLVLRDLLYTYVPQEMVDRPKSGFSIPLGRWLRTDMREWAEAKITASRNSSLGLLNHDEIDRRWAEHLSGRRDNETFIWSVIMFQDWVDSQLIHTKLDIKTQ